MKFNCIMLKLVIDYSFTFKLFWPLIVNWQNRFSLSLCDESAGCGFRYFFPPPASYQNILMNFTRYRLRHLSFCRCVSGNMSTPISSTENTLLSHTHTPHPPAHTTARRLQCTQINMSNLLKDRPKIVSSVSLRDYESGEPEINEMQTDGCHIVCLPFAPDSPMCTYVVVWGDISMSAIYSKSSVVKACWIFKGEVLRVNFVARVSTDNPSTESTPSRYSLGRTIRAHDSTDHASYGYENFIRSCY